MMFYCRKQLALLRKKRHNGFTLIELLLYMGILTILLSGLTLFALNVVSIGQKSATQQELQDAGKYVSERIRTEIRSASAINTLTSNFNVNLATSSLLKLSLQTSAPNNPTEISVNSGKVSIKQGTGAVTALHSDDIEVVSLIFGNNSSGTTTENISFILTLRPSVNSARQEYSGTVTIQSSVELRN